MKTNACLIIKKVCKDFCRDSNEVSNLKDLRTKTRVSLVQLLNNTGRPYDFEVSRSPLTYSNLATPSGLAEIAAYAQRVGAKKN